MKVDKDKLLISMARACMDFTELARKAQISRATLYNASAGRDISPATLGVISRALDIDPAEIIEKGE